MNEKQRAKAKFLCDHFDVEFVEENFHKAFGYGDGWVEGQVGSVFFGISPEGDAHS